MPGHHLALIGSFLLWAGASVLCLLLFHFRFSVAAKPGFLRQLAGKFNFFLAVIIIAVLASVLAAYLYNTGGHMEDGNGISWGCYMEDFGLYSLICWSFGVAALTLLLLIGLINPAAFNYPNKKRIFLAYLSQVFCSLLLIFIMSGAIQHLSGPLSGKGHTCL